jgi:hypothetical protein
VLNFDMHGTRYAVLAIVTVSLGLILPIEVTAGPTLPS